MANAVDFLCGIVALMHCGLHNRICSLISVLLLSVYLTSVFSCSCLLALETTTKTLIK
jgi:hypothetical protein